MQTRTILAVLLVLGYAAGCGERGDKSLLSVRRAGTEETAATDTATVYGGDVVLTREELERGRLDESWRRYADLDTAGTPVPPEALPGSGPSAPADRWAGAAGDLGALRGDTAAVLTTQILLDRVHFSPGVIDGRWGKNTAKALYWLQRREGLPATGEVDSTTLTRLRTLAGAPDSLFVSYRLRPEDVAGPFARLPHDIYERAKLKGMYFESLSEKLGEQFHVAPALLRRLNPGVAIDSLKAGASLRVPNLAAADTAADTVAGGAAGGAAGAVARLVVSDGGHYLHAYDAAGRLLYHFPSSLGSAYDPSPTGQYKVASITRNPWWHYQPKLLAHVPDTARDARIPPGPNSAVGLVWIALDKRHFGIHGTSAPEGIGYASSAGCVRLTNWDVLFLAGRLQPGVEVDFRDVTDDEGSPADSTRQGGDETQRARSAP